MFRKYFTLFLAAILIAANAIPAARAAENDPLVLHTEMNDTTNAVHYYQADGTRARSEWIGYGTGNYTEYSYIGFSLIQEDEYEDNKLYATTVYDLYGTEIEYFQYDESGKIVSHQMSQPTYDELGRLINWHQLDPDNPDGGTTDIRYEYNGEPTVFLGKYEQDGNLTNGPEPIEWLVIGAEGENILLVSKYGLSSRPYHNKSKSIKWETSDIRTWLNGEFYETAFSDDPIRYQSLFTLFSTPESGITDRLFLLSRDEVKQYFPKEEDRICIPTPYAVQQKAYTKYGTGAGWWLLRTPGKTSREVVNINTDGGINADGAKVSGKAGMIRPAMWVSKTIFSDAEETPSRKHENVTMIDSKTKETKYLSSHLYTYDDAGHLICDQDYLTGDLEKWEYDDHGNLTRFIYLNASGSYCVEETYTNRYFDNGLLLEQETFLVITEEIQGKTSKTTKTRLEAYVYDAAGHLTFTVGTSSDGQSHTESRTYDAHGNLLTVAVNGGVINERYTYVPLSQALLK
ncbi:MAG: hypothetical protein IJN20_03800 [Oscillospiraceae bacterium]|nr:hypothetical protein [Oscillospiraceae bacterium]